MPSTAVQQEIAGAGRLAIVPAILKLFSELTGMRLTLVSRVTAKTWTACAVHDRLDFGLRLGDE